jgi:MFS transporter
VSSVTYRALLRIPGAAGFFLTATVGRVGIAMTSLGIVWLVHGHTGSYAAAGLVTGGFAVTDALAGPQVARLIDRFGQTRVLPPTLLAHGMSVAVLLGLVLGGTPSWLMMMGGVLVGATLPQLGASSAARWSALLRKSDRTAELPTAFALESLSNALAYLAGPVLVSAVGASGHPELGTALAAALVILGGLVFAAQRRTAPPLAFNAAERIHAGGSLLRPGFAVLVGLNLAIGVYFGAMQVSVTAFTVEHAAVDTAAPIFAVSSASGLLVGWLYGLRRWHAAPRRQLAVATTGLALGSLLLLAVTSPLGLGSVVVLTGGAVPPIIVLFSVLAESAVHRAAVTQAFTWMNSAGAAGSASAAAIAGQMVDALGAHGGFIVAVVASAAMAVLSTAGARALREPGQHRLASESGSRSSNHP